VDQVSDILVQRFSAEEIEWYLLGLVGCLLLAIIGFVISLCLHASGGSFWSVLKRPVRPRRPMRRLEEGDLKPLRRFDAYGNRKRKKGSLWQNLFGG
jgi:hypothetical protein